MCNTMMGINGNEKLDAKVETSYESIQHAGYTVTYDSANHWSVLTQMWGSVWPKVLPYCIFNVVSMLVLEWLNHKENIDMEISTRGHTFITLVVSFLLVSRVQIALSRYSVARDHLATMYRESRELIQNMVVFSFDDQSIEARQWRNNVAYRSLILLRTAMEVVRYDVTKVPAWEVPELQGEELKDVRKSILLTKETRRWRHEERSIMEESLRVPIRIAYLLRKSIHMQQKILSPRIEFSQENMLLSSVDGFMNGYYGMRRFLTTPVPFPLIQMARTFLFLYVFTTPFAFLSGPSSTLAHCCMVFIITYGFVGLELVAIELDNPFGDDENDFDIMSLGKTAFEDTYLVILDVDGMEYADRLRSMMHDKSEKDYERNHYKNGDATEETCLLLDV